MSNTFLSQRLFPVRNQRLTIHRRTRYRWIIDPKCANTSIVLSTYISPALIERLANSGVSFFVNAQIHSAPEKVRAVQFSSHGDILSTQIDISITDTSESVSPKPNIYAFCWPWYAANCYRFLGSLTILVAVSALPNRYWFLDNLNIVHTHFK